MPQVWREGLTTVLRLQRIPLVQYRAINCRFVPQIPYSLFQTLTNSVFAPESKLVTLEPDGKINYRRFLQRYVLITSESVRLRWSITVQVRIVEPLTNFIGGMTGLAARCRS